MTKRAPQATRDYVLGYVEARSKVSSRHKLPTRHEISTISYGLFKPEPLLRALDELVSEGMIIQSGLYYGTTIPEVE